MSDVVDCVNCSDGAKVLFPPGFETPLIVQKKDGGFGYDSTDMTAIHYRVFTMKANWIIYVVDSGQSLHFQQVFAAAKAAGWLDSEGVCVCVCLFVCLIVRLDCVSVVWCRVWKCACGSRWFRRGARRR